MYVCSLCPHEAQVQTDDHGYLCFDCLREKRGVRPWKNIVFSLTGRSKCGQVVMEQKAVKK
jgi:hypothetical protein